VTARADSVLSRWRAVALDLLYGTMLGAAIGVIVLGVGGRIAMRAVALIENTPTGFSLGGTGTVVFLGAVSGAAGGLLYAALLHIIPRQVWLRLLVFALLLLLITLRGLNPVDAVRAGLFIPLVALFAAALHLGWHRARGWRSP
jgi:hypothetical protein